MTVKVLGKNYINVKPPMVRHLSSVLSAIVASPKKLRDKLQRGHATGCNLPATCLATPLRIKLQEKLHLVALA